MNNSFRKTSDGGPLQAGRGADYLPLVLLSMALLFGAEISADGALRYVDANSTNSSRPYTSWSTAAQIIQDAVDAAAPGDAIMVTNGIYTTGGRPVGTNVLVNRVAVDKPVSLRSLNGPQFTIIQGHQVPGTTNGDGAVRCVYLTGGASLSGFTLTNGATHILDAPPHPESSGGGVWCVSTSAVVSNCVITGNSAEFLGGGAYGGTLKNCTLRNNSATQGGGASFSTLSDCTLIGNSAGLGGGASLSTLNNCTLTGNTATAEGGGGADQSTVSNCLLTGNSADGGGGGGAHWGTLNNCVLTGNSASAGGGTVLAGLNNCTLTGNTASAEGGGAFRGTLTNCIVYYNSAPNGANYSAGESGSISLDYCCTTPMPTSGAGNITDAPRFVDYTDGNLRLQPDSPCINSGFNASAPGLIDLDGEPRLAGGTVDIGAYEFQGSGWQPQVPTQPRSVAAFLGSNARFSVTTAGAGPLSYQWQRDGNDLPNATNAALTVTRLTLADLGSYTVRVRNPWGETSSQPAWLKLARWTDLVVFDASYSMANFSNGKSWVEWFAERAALSAPGQVKNYATGRATGADVRAQINRYLSADKPGSNTLLAPWWAGMTSDLLGQFLSVSEVISNYSANLTQLAQAGARLFIIPNLPPLYGNPGLDSPYARSLDYDDINARMDREIQKLQADYEVTVFRFDYSAFASQLAENPAAYGFTNATSAAKTLCPPGDPRKFLWWDGGHPTTAHHRLISEAIYDCLTPPLVLESLVPVPGGMVELQWRGGSPPFRLQSCEDLAVGNWQSAETTFATNARIASEASRQFLRILQLGQ